MNEFLLQFILKLVDEEHLGSFDLSIMTASFIESHCLFNLLVDPIDSRGLGT